MTPGPMTPAHDMDGGGMAGHGAARQGAGGHAAFTLWRRRRDGLPGFGVGLSLTLGWLGVLVILPLLALLARPWAQGVGSGLGAFAHIVHDGRMLAALRVSFVSALVAAALDVVAGVVIAWGLVRVRVPGWRVIDALVELPFALPTAVVGITMATLYGPHGWVGAPLSHLGMKVAFTPLGIVVALMFVGLPFVVRTVVPVLRALPPEAEEVARTLGATRAQVVARVVMPALYPALLTAFAMAFARGVGEYGSVIFIAGNQPYHTEIAPLLIVIRLQEYDTQGASLIGLVLVAIAMASLGVIAWVRRHVGRGGAGGAI
ncbi:sulfate ABC transporter permease subunit CysT [Novacetimonas hansenii]|uniref:sulfate ABC transporter permease subunit CysT n=1 Tax=Novacetimonas hansenii TaxID=436 RepID=UPI000A3EF5E8|nr:sulfate ABC transporter permease subunit CysT [Novacetimonas hansenii]